MSEVPEAIRGGTVNNARLMVETDARAKAIAAEIDSMALDVIGFQETEEWLEAKLAKLLRGEWIVASDRANCPVMARSDRFDRFLINGKSWIPINMQGSVRMRYGSAVALQRKSDGFRFIFATIHPSNNGESSATQAAKDRIREAESFWQQLEVWGVTEFPIFVVGDMNDKSMPPNGLPGVLVKHGMIDALAALRQGPRIDRAFVKDMIVLTAAVNTVSSKVSDHDYGLFVVAPKEAPPKPLHGVDVSSWQGANWIPEPGDSFTGVKASEGTTYTNPARWSQLSAARSAGHVIMHYHFMHPGKAVDQARFFVESADVHAGDLMVCDWEATASGHASVADAAAFIAEVKRLLPENKCGLYCNRSDWMGTSVKAGDFLWIAEYGVDQPGTKSPWLFWQYSRDPIDRNWCSLTDLDELKTWAGVPDAVAQ